MSEKGDIELCSNFSFLTTGTNLTPSSSDMEDVKSEYDSANADHNATVPWPGGTYIIRDPKSKLQITLVDGVLRMEPHLGDQGGYHWRCILKDGWLGFCSPVDGLHLGHNNNGNIVAQQRHHQYHEYFITRGHPDGGQVLLTKHDHILSEVFYDGYRFRIVRENGTVWEFLKV